MVENISFKNRLIKYNIKINILNGIAAVIVFNLTNSYFVKFAERIGASDYHIAYLSSLPALVSVFALIPGAILIESFSNKKAITGSIFFIHKVFFLLLALVPFVDKSYQPWLFVALVGLMNLPGSISATGYQSSIGDIFDEKTRGMAMGLRNRYSTVFGIIFVFLVGQLLTKLPKTNSETIVLYQILFVFAFIVGLGEVISYFKLRGIKKRKRSSSSEYIKLLKETFKTIHKERDFLIFTGCSLLFHFGWQMGWPLFSIYTIKFLKANEIWLGVISIASGLSSMITYTIWAKFADRKGNSLTLSIATFGMAVTPILYALSHTLTILVFYNIIIGISVAGTTLILFNILLDVTPKKNRTIYIAIYNTLINASAAISPVIGVAIKDSFNIYIALIIVSCIRIMGSFAFFLRNKYSR